MYFLLFLGWCLYSIGLIGVLINRSNFIMFLMCLELMFLGVITILVCGSVLSGDLSGQIFSIFIVTVAAAESAIGLSLLVSYHRDSSTVDLETADSIKF